VLGQPEYYPKFRFVTASASNVDCEFEGVSDEAFMIRWFKQPASINDRVVAIIIPYFRRWVRR
jgi:predicted N-acetyltransferase YhbS